MDRDELHGELDRIIPPTTKRRSYTRAIGHAMIELGLLTKIECAYSDCVMMSREFPVWTEITPPQDRAQPIIDHVVELWQGGTDMPDNFQLIHFACNCRKTARLRMADPVHKARVADQTRERWNDPTYRTKMTQTSRNVSDAARQSRSDKMKAHWADPEKRAHHTSKLSRGNAWHERRGK